MPLTTLPLYHSHLTDSIMLGYSIGSAETPKGKLDVIASGSTVRFVLQGREGYCDLDLGPAAAEALALLAGSESC